MEGEWSCYGGGQFNGEWSCYRSGHFNAGRMDKMVLMEVVMEVASFKEGEWSCYRGQFNGEHGHVTEVASLMEREWSCYGGGQLARIDMLHGPV